MLRTGAPFTAAVCATAGIDAMATPAVTSAVAIMRMIDVGRECSRSRYFCTALSLYRFHSANLHRKSHCNVNFLSGIHPTPRPGQLIGKT